MEPRWNYTDINGYGWQERTRFLGGTNHFDIYIDFEGNLRLTCGPTCNDNWHWVERSAEGNLLPVRWSDPPEEWGKLFYEDRRNIEAYLTCFAPDWHERGLELGRTRC